MLVVLVYRRAALAPWPPAPRTDWTPSWVSARGSSGGSRAGWVSGSRCAS